MHRGELSSITGLHPVDARNIFPVVTAQNVPGCSLNLRGGGGQKWPLAENCCLRVTTLGVERDDVGKAPGTEPGTQQLLRKRELLSGQEGGWVGILALPLNELAVGLGQVTLAL